REAEEGESSDSLQLSDAYVHSLVSLGLERLHHEPLRLQAEADAVDQALHSLSLNHYGVFIQNQECVRHVKTKGAAMNDHLSSLLSEARIPSEFGSFQREAGELINGHKRNRQTLKHHMQAIPRPPPMRLQPFRFMHSTRCLVELLEVPQLMDACVRNDLYQEALTIATFAATLERRHWNRHPPSISAPSSGAEPCGQETEEDHTPGVIHMMVKEVRESTAGLEERLLAKLQGPVQLTTCLPV
ncbi:unnamed protein product, partial [Discosporangium mesarthrocarpum]